MPFYKGGTGDRALVQRSCQEHDIESCIHFAALAYVGESVADLKLYFETTVVDEIGNLQILSAIVGLLFEAADLFREFLKVQLVECRS